MVELIHGQALLERLYSVHGFAPWFAGVAVSGKMAGGISQPVLGVIT